MKIALNKHGKVVAFEAPEKPKHDYGASRTWEEVAYTKKLETAIENGMEFKDQIVSHFICFGYESDINKIQQGKLYPIPEGYEVIINHPLDNAKPYAILVPKQEPVKPKGIISGGFTLGIPKPKQDEQKQHLIDMMKEDEKNGMYEVPKQKDLEPEFRASIEKNFDRLIDGKQPASIEEAAAKYARDYEGMQWEKDRVEIAFINGAEFMYKQFKQEKK
jgi:hypothetical protein